MSIYFGTFFASYLFCLYGERLNKNGRKKTAKNMIFVAALIPAILAGVRDYTIGTDIATYGHWTFIAAKNSSNPINFAIVNKSLDFFYSIMVYCIAHIFESEHWLYFFTGLLTYLFSILGLYRYREYISVSVAWICYLFLFFGDTLNLMRQSIAISIFMLAFSYFQRGDKVKFGILLVTAMLFHSTAIIGVLFVVIYILLEKRNSMMTKTGIIATMLVLMFGYAKIINIVVNLGFFNEKYMKYTYQATSGFSLNPILIRLPYLILIGLFYFSCIKETGSGIKKNFVDYIIVIIIIEMIAAEMRMFNASLYRISLYFGMFRCVGIGRVMKVVKPNNRQILIWIIGTLLIITWIYQNVVQGNNQIYSFTSEILGI